MVDGYYEAMRKKGFSYNTTASIKKFKCPNCGFEFSMVYARTIACQGCSEAWNNCPKMRCAKCDHEFWITETPDVHNKYQQANVSQHLSKVVTDWNESYGYSKNR